MYGKFDFIVHVLNMWTVKRSQPYLSGGAKWKDLPDFPPLFPDFRPLFQMGIFGNFFAVKGGTLPLKPPPVAMPLYVELEVNLSQIWEFGLIDCRQCNWIDTWYFPQNFGNFSLKVKLCK